MELSAVLSADPGGEGRLAVLNEHVEALSRLGWSCQTHSFFHPDGTLGWTAEATRNNAKVVTFAQTPERAARMAANVVQQFATDSAR